MKKRMLALLIVCVMICSAGCRREPPSEDSFELILFNGLEEDIHCGDLIGIIVRLANLTDREYMLVHGYPLISLYVRPEGETLDSLIGATRMETKLEPNGMIEKELQVQFSEPGDYFLRAFCMFEIDGKEYHYELERTRLHVVKKEAVSGAS